MTAETAMTAGKTAEIEMSLGGMHPLRYLRRRLVVSEAGMPGRGRQVMESISVLVLSLVHHRT